VADAATALAQFAPVGTQTLAPPIPRWRSLTKIAFRFFASYFALYIVTTQMLGTLIPLGNVNLGGWGPIRWTVEWTARNLFGVTSALVVSGSGSGDKTYDWVLAVVLLTIAAVITVAWGIAARRVENHETAQKWFRLFLRFALGTTMLSYGSAKFIPLQMPFPSLTRLVEPYGNFSPMGVLWASIGASPSYEVFTGLAEASAAVLLFIPRTTTLGALVALGCTIEIFALNMTYDVPVKLFSFHLVAMALFLLAPDAKRLLNVLLLNRAVEPAVVPPLLKSGRANRNMLIAQLVFGALMIGVAINNSVSAWTKYGGGAPQSPLYGVWTVAHMSIDGVELPPLVTNWNRWRRVIFDRPTMMSFQRMDDTIGNFPVKIDMTAKSVALSRVEDPTWTSTLAFEQTGADRLTLSGNMNGKKFEMRLELFPRDKFLLVSRGFHWIQEYPFNR
jgi:hypothetical protein